MTTAIDPNLPDPESVEVRDAATIVLLRDACGRGDRGIEVAMMQRNIDSDFVGGAYVFPGGAVDPADGEPESLSVCDGLEDRDASGLVGTDTGGLRFWVAVVREAFEEAGVLLAHHADGRHLVLDADAGERFAVHRRAVDRRERPLWEICRDEDLRLEADRIHCFARWITPLGGHRRYDTRFFVAAAPPEQEIAHDDFELVTSEWIAPGEALRRQVTGEMVMIFPTVRTLVWLERFDTVDEVLIEAGSRTEVPAWLPTITPVDGQLRLEIPGDPEGVGGFYDAETGLPLGAGPPAAPGTQSVLER